jgi:hypothetical protein
MRMRWAVRRRVSVRRMPHHHRNRHRHGLPSPPLLASLESGEELAEAGKD